MRKTVAILVSGAIGGSVYAFIMSATYIWLNEENFSFMRFIIDFTLGAALMMGLSWWQMRKNNKNNKQ